MIALTNHSGGKHTQQLLELKYAPNAVQHILSGKAIARAVRGHFIIDAAVNALLSSISLGQRIPLLQQAQSIDDEPLEPDVPRVNLSQQGLFEIHFSHRDCALFNTNLLYFLQRKRDALTTNLWHLKILA